MHSKFNIRVKQEGIGVCDIPKDSNNAKAQMLRKAKVIICDEAPMAHRDMFEIIDRSLRDILNNDEPFGGKVIVLCGDFRQVLPIVKSNDPGEVVNAAINKSKLWKFIDVFHLTKNVRVGLHGNSPKLQEFAAILQLIGEGTYPTEPKLNDMIRIPDEWISKASNLDDFIDEIFPDIEHKYHESVIENAAILTPWNAEAETINHKILQKIPKPLIGPLKRCNYSIDMQDSTKNYSVQDEHLKLLHPPDLPPDELFLKVGSIVILLRNYDQIAGACNGTKLRICHIKPHVIECVILNGNAKGNHYFIHRFPIKSEHDIPFYRYQFPIKLAWAMTINKAQGQTLDRVGLYLPFPVFSHGQLYVACGRVGSPDRLSIFVTDGPEQGHFENFDGVYTHNVVYKDALILGKKQVNKYVENDINYSYPIKKTATNHKSKPIVSSKQQSKYSDKREMDASSDEDVVEEISQEQELDRIISENRDCMEID